MNRSHQWMSGLALSTLLLVGCVSKVTEKEQYSGYLDRYDVLKPAVSASGAPTLRWVSSTFNPSAYDTAIFDELVLYPAPKATDRVNVQTLEQLRSTASQGAMSALSKRYRVVDSSRQVPAGGRALILRAAITGVSASNEGMKWYEVIPVAAVVGTVSAASGHRDQNSELYLEAALLDAQTNEPLARVVRKVFGKQLNNASTQITASDFDQAIKDLTNDLGAFIK
ncbi:DUF3313 domain-containing protein [Pseudomonas sp. CFBP 8770]|uniref:DUF3313 domain-containing protein n=1 Tax=unclassified Pseudomonas TaxID=196821 RepID=UPI0017813198|nr:MULTISPECIES: DUF3313 domain-containing protein [unclassified Pseudomonas]MBD8472904.1 DUF3313 domain-containing protein [Pseudomonas sp. CFBP 8773]MBD8645993.1 DUF3313 domain-containing protein [Pseudomonas sp. CFBP 8770]